MDISSRFNAGFDDDVESDYPGLYNPQTDNDEDLVLTPDDASEIEQIIEEVQSSKDESDDDWWKEYGTNSQMLYIRDCMRYQVLSEEEQMRLIEIVRDQEKSENERMNARNELVVTNLRLALVVINRYFPGQSSTTMTYEDMISVGVVGIMHAIDLYDPAKGAKLSSYICAWCREKIQRAIASVGFSVRISDSLYRQQQKINVTKAKLLQDSQRNPSDKEIADALKIPVYKVTTVERATQRFMSIDQIVDGHTAADQQVSGHKTMHECISTETESLEDELIKRMDDNLLTRTLATLKPEWQQIAILRYGLYGQRQHTYGEIAGIVRLSRETVRKRQELIEKMLQYVARYGEMPPPKKRRSRKKKEEAPTAAKDSEVE